MNWRVVEGGVGRWRKELESNGGRRGQVEGGMISGLGGSRVSL